MQTSQGPEFAKGNGTENDFIILPDPSGELDLTAARVRALCDRRRGLGADGVLRVVRTGDLGDAPAGTPARTWFMDYRNADGSTAEMCGNGVRVFARYLVESGLAETAPDTAELPIGTRAGLRTVVTHPDGQVSVDMGPATVRGESSTVVDGDPRKGLAVDVGNPHLACVIPEGLEALDLSVAPSYDTDLFTDGVNIELVQDHGPGRVRMRVHERGVGETRSCGTGTVAAAVAALHADGHGTGNRIVEVAGGTVEVEVTARTSVLTGPAVLVGEGRLDADWWQRIGEA